MIYPLLHLRVDLLAVFGPNSTNCPTNFPPPTKSVLQTCPTNNGEATYKSTISLVILLPDLLYILKGNNLQIFIFRALLIGAMDKNEKVATLKIGE